MLCAVVGGCHRDRPGRETGDAAPPLPMGLTSEQGEQVLAKVGERVITLAEFAATLERMDRLDRLRYQTVEKQKELLEELIDAELLAQDAREKGLDKLPETQEAIRQVLHDTLLAEVRRDLPSLDALPRDKVRAHYEAHRADYHDPERRRVSHIPIDDRETAKKVVHLAQGTTPAQWGEVYGKYGSPLGRRRDRPLPPELSGDMGIVSPPGAPDDGSRIAEPIRVAVFALSLVGDVAAQPVEVDGMFHVIRLMGKTEPHDRTFEEAERSIRLQMLEELATQRERDFEQTLRKQIPVEIDEKALAQVALPGQEHPPDAGH